MIVVNIAYFLMRMSIIYACTLWTRLFCLSLLTFSFIVSGWSILFCIVILGFFCSFSGSGGSGEGSGIQTSLVVINQCPVVVV